MSGTHPKSSDHTQDTARWLRKDLWAVNDAVCLLHNVDPSNRDDMIRRSRQFKEQYLDDMDTVEKAEGNSLQIFDLPTYIGAEGKVFAEVDPKIFIQWAGLKGFEIPEPFQHLLNEPSETSRYQYPEYYSSELKVLLQAADRFWKNADPDDSETQPEKEIVVGWLKEQGLSGTKATNGAAIIRPRWAFQGRKGAEQ
jgi:hypothetical protein